MNKLNESRPYKAAIAFFNRITIPGFQGVPVGTVMNFFVASLSKGILFHRAAAMTYRIFIALIPLLMALFAGISFLGEEVRKTILSFMETIVPKYVWPAISNMITEVVMKQNGPLLWFSFVFGVAFAIVCVNSLINIMNTTYYRSRRRPFFRQLGVVLLILAIWFVTILLATAVFLGASVGFAYLDSHIFNSPKLMSTILSLTKWILLFSLVYIFISLLYYLAPADRKKYRFFSAGSTFASITMVIVLAAMNYYFSNFSNYNLLYGSLGAILAILLWIYWNAMFILIGFDLNTSIVQAKRSISDEKENEFNCGRNIKYDRCHLIFAIIALSFFSCKNKGETVPPSSFVSIEDDHFIVEGDTFFPLMLNYIVSFQNEGDRFIIAPSLTYDSCGYADAVGEEAVRRQLMGHFGLISDLGFNTVRICFDRAGQDDDGRFYYQAGRKFYLDNKKDRRAILQGVETLVGIAEEQGLKVMLLIKPPFNECKDLQKFTKDLLDHFRNCPTIFAYDFMNEPLYFDPEPKRKKKDALSIVRQWRQMMDQHAPNQLFTIGFSEPIEVFEWDCLLLPVDFVEFHTYHPLRVPNEIYWYAKYCGKPWMIGETGLPADNDSITYEEQAQFVIEAYQIARDAGGCGFGLWEFQDNAHCNYEANHTGLLAHGGVTYSTRNGKYPIKGTLKPAARVIASLAQNYTPRLHKFPTSDCGDYPVNYYNMLGYKNICIFGQVVDTQTEDGIEGAVIRGWNDDWSVGVNTYSDNVGVFFLYCNDVCTHFEISAPGYSKIKFDKEISFEGVSANADDILRTLPAHERRLDIVKGTTLSKCGLPDQKREYQTISYHPFVKKNIPDSCFFRILNFEPALFEYSDWEGQLGIFKLEKLTQ